MIELYVGRRTTGDLLSFVFFPYILNLSKWAYITFKIKKIVTINKGSL